MIFKKLLRVTIFPAFIKRKIWKHTGNFVDYRRDVITFKLYISTIFIICISYSIQYTNGIINDLFIAPSQIAVFILCAYLLYKGKDLWSKTILLSFVNVTFFISASMSGRVVPSYLYFIPIITGTLFFYRTHQVKHAILMLALAFINLVALEFTDYATFSNELVLSPHQVKIRVVICLTVSLTLGAILMRELIVMNLYNQRKLRRLNQNLKKRNERLRKINNELDSFVYRSSHDLRSPLTSIMGIINIIRSETSIEKVQEYMSFQERSVKKLDSLIQDILDISRNSRLGLVVGPVFLKQFVEKSLDSLSYMEEYKKVTVIVDIPENMTIYSDTNRLKVVFNNLLSNGLRYCDLSKPHSTVHVTVVSVNKQGVRIEVKDNGIGVRKEHMSKIFDMFYRATDRNNGSGLGLYIVKEAVTKLGGKVAFTSTYGEGTTVSLFLPDIAPPFEQVEMSNGTLFVNS